MATQALGHDDAVEDGSVSRKEQEVEGVRPAGALKIGVHDDDRARPHFDVRAGLAGNHVGRDDRVPRAHEGVTDTCRIRIAYRAIGQHLSATIAAASIAPLPGSVVPGSPPTAPGVSERPPGCGMMFPMLSGRKSYSAVTPVYAHTGRDTTSLHPLSAADVAAVFASSRSNFSLVCLLAILLSSIVPPCSP